MTAALLSTAYYVPENTCTSADLSAQFPDWEVEKIESKTGISVRHIAAADQTSADLAASAAERLFATGAIKPTDIDFLLFCTESPDYFLPPSACILQSRLGLRRDIGAFDFNLGCSGFVYGLGMAKALIESGQARNVLLLTAETYSKFMHAGDRSVRTIFGDGGAAAWIGSVQAPADGRPYIAAPLYGTDGSGAKHLIVKRGAFRNPGRGADDPGSFLYMNGPEVFRFTLDTVVSNIRMCVENAQMTVADLDLVIPHQANAFMLESLRVKLGIQKDRFVVNVREFGNTVSATLPIAITEESKGDRLRPDASVLLSGFGVGLSWASVVLRRHPAFSAWGAL